MKWLISVLLFPIMLQAQFVVPYYYQAPVVAGGPTAVVYDNATAYNTGSTSDPQTFSYTAGADANYLTVAVCMNSSTGWINGGVTWNGTAMDSLCHYISGTSIKLWLFGKKIPSNTGTHDIVVDLNAGKLLMVCASSWKNVNQTTPTGTAVGSAASSKKTISAIMTCTTADAVVAVCHGGSNYTLTPNYTGLMEAQANGSTWHGACQYVVSTANPTMTWTWSNNGNAVIGAIPLIF